MTTWTIASSKSFSPLSWPQIAINIKPDRFAYLLSLIDFLLCYSLSLADTERGFSAMICIKSIQRTQDSNKLLMMHKD